MSKCVFFSAILYILWVLDTPVLTLNEVAAGTSRIVCEESARIFPDCSVLNNGAPANRAPTNNFASKSYP